jgi:ABC-type branched-subunit amino acid transport system substrate-binding protein
MVRKHVKKFSSLRGMLLILAATASMHAEIFDSLDLLKEYAAKSPVSVPVDNNDYLNPDYVKYLESQAPTAIDKMLMTVGLKRRSIWRPERFIELLRRVTQKRKKDGLRGQFVQRQEVSQDDHFLVWSNLQGAYHSLVYALENLVERKIIDKNLKIIESKYFMVFSGNVIDRSVYSLETLTIVLRLLDANPNRVFYIKGDHESNGLWRDYDLRDQLESKVAVAMGINPPYKDGIVPFTDDLEALFDTLPKALYLGMKTVDAVQSIRIGHFTRDQYQLPNDELSYVLNNPDQTIFTVPLELPKERKNEMPVEVIGMTEGSSALIPNYNDQGLRLLPPDEGTTAWIILSAQTDSFEHLYKFFTDSYVDIAIGLPMKQSTITQHYQDSKNRTGFKTGRVYNIFCGQADEQYRAQPNMNVLPIGSTIDLKGQAAILGRQIQGGLSLAINKQNQQGIAAGQVVSLTMLNDDHLFAKMRRNIEELYKNYQIKILLGIEESMMARGYFDLIQQYDLLVLFPFTGMDSMRTAKHTNLVHYGPSYKQEADISTRYIIDTIAPNKIAILYEKEQIGQDALAGVRAVCKEKGFTALVEIPFTSTELNFKEQIALIRHEDPDTLGIFTSSAIGQEFMRQIGVQNLARRTLFALSSFGAQTFRQYYQGRGLRMITTNLVPSPFKSDLLIAQDFRKEAVDNNIIVSPQTFEAYITTSIFVEALRITKGAITPQSIKQTLEAMNNYAFKGLKLTFNKTTRELSNTIWLDLGDGKDWRPFTAQKYTISATEKVQSEMSDEQPAAVAKEVSMPKGTEPAKEQKKISAPKEVAPVKESEVNEDDASA